MQSTLSGGQQTWRSVYYRLRTWTSAIGARDGTFGLYRIYYEAATWGEFESAMPDSCEVSKSKCDYLNGEDEPPEVGDPSEGDWEWESEREYGSSDSSSEWSDLDADLGGV